MRYINLHLTLTLTLTLTYYYKLSFAYYLYANVPNTLQQSFFLSEPPPLKHYRN